MTTRNLVLFFALLLSFSVFAAGPANYSGNWSLDKSASKDLPPFYEQVKSHSLKITQNEKELLVAVEVTSGAHEPDRFDVTFHLDGQPVKSDAQVRTPNGPMKVPATFTAQPEADGGLTITIERELPSRDGQPFKGTTVEKWRLSQDGKTLTIDRSDTMRGGSFASTMIFTRS